MKAVLKVTDPTKDENDGNMQAYGCNSLCNSAAYAYAKGYHQWYKMRAEEAVQQFFGPNRTSEEKQQMVETRMAEMPPRQKRNLTNWSWKLLRAFQKQQS